MELSDVKPGKKQDTKPHHIEVYPKGISYGELVAQFQATGAEVIKEENLYHPTYDVILPDGFIIRLSEGPLLKKIISEMQ